MNAHNAHRHGMTLIELMAAVAILGVMVALSVISYDAAIKKQQGANTARQLMSEMQRARKMSLTSGQPVRFVVKDVTVAGVTHRIARWEKLPCADSWGRSCPSTACKSNTCSDNFLGVVVNTGCDCDQMGDPVEIPNDPPSNLPMTVDWEPGATDGICFEPGTGTARVGWRCNIDPAGTVDPLWSANPTYLRILVRDQPRRYLMLDDVTGNVRLHDCGAHDQSGAPTGGCP